MPINGGRTLSLRDLKDMARNEVKEELQEEYNKKLQAVEDTKDIQAMSTDETDPYMVGLYNGLELACAIIANRDPDFADIKKELTSEDIAESLRQGIAAGLSDDNKKLDSDVHIVSSDVIMDENIERLIHNCRMADTTDHPLLLNYESQSEWLGK